MQGRKNHTVLSLRQPLCESRWVIWVERHTAFQDFEDYYEALLPCLESTFLDSAQDSQGSTLAVIEAYKLVNVVKEQLKGMHKNPKTAFASPVYEKIKKIAEKSERQAEHASNLWQADIKKQYQCQYTRRLLSSLP